MIKKITLDVIAECINCKYAIISDDDILECERDKKEHFDTYYCPNWEIDEKIFDDVIKRR